MVPGGQTERAQAPVGETGESTPLPRAGTCWSALSGRKYCAKPGGTAGILILSQQVIAGTGFFVFQGGYFMFVYTKRWRSRAASEILNPHLNALKQT